MTDREMNLESPYLISNLFIDEAKCTACGACISISNLIAEDAYGKAKVAESGIISKEGFKSVKQAIDICPTEAISIIKSQSIVNKQGVEGLIELKEMISKELLEYEVTMPTEDMYRFDKDMFSFPWIEPWNNTMGRSYEKTDYDGYRSERKAKREGISEFNSIWHSRLKTLVQYILIEYKNMYLNRYYRYKDGDNWDFYSNVNENIEKRLKQIVIEAQILADNKLELPNDFESFEVVPRFLEDEFAVYRLTHFEEIFIVDNIVEQRESLSWYESYINTDGSDKSYNYDLSEAVNSLQKWTLSDIQSEVNFHIGDIIKNALYDFCKDVTELITSKANLLNKLIGDYIDRQ